MSRNEELQDYDLLRIGSMQKRIAELEESNFLYAMELYLAEMLEETDPNYEECKEIHDVYRTDRAEDKEAARKAYVNSLDAMDYEAGDPE